MKSSQIIMILAIGLLLGSAVLQGQAQTSPSAPPAANSAPAATVTDKKAISKECSDQANQKGLHGKERRKFRSECKRNGGKA